MRKRWYFMEAEEPTAIQAPTTAPNVPQQQQENPQQQKQQENPPLGEQPDDDITQDPKEPDIPQEDNENQDFEEWRNHFFKLAIKGDSQELIESLKKVRDRDLDATQRKFVEDNLQIQWLRQDSNVEKLSKLVRKSIKDQLDKNYPGTTVMQHIISGLEQVPQLDEVFYKFCGYYGMKGDLHRKFLSSIICAVQVGGGGSREDLVYNEKEYSINISTRFSTEWGEIALGKWALQTDDPERYLEEPELARLKDGAPEEKTVLRHRIVLSSIAERFKTRAFLIHVVDPKGKIYCLAWDMGDSVMAGYQDGKLVVRTKSSEHAEATIDDDGNIHPLTDLVIRYVKETGKRDDTGTPQKKELPFMERINGMLYLTADAETVKEMAGGMQGVFFKEIPYSGNPSDITRISRCIVSLNEFLMRKC